MSTQTSRRAALGAILVAPLASAPALATPHAQVPDHEARFLALVPWLRTVLPPAEALKAAAQTLSDEADAQAGQHPGWDDRAAVTAWLARARANREANGHIAPWTAWNDVALAVDKAVAPYLPEYMSTLPAALWKIRVADFLDCWQEEACVDLAALLREGTE